MSESGSFRPYGYDIDEWRSRIPACERWVLMNNCSQTPQCDHTRMAAESYLESWNRDCMDWDAWTDLVEAAKAEFAGLINARPEEIAMSTSVSEATAGLISGFSPKGRHKIVLSEAEFPSVAHIMLAHQRCGFELEWVPIRDGLVELDDYAKAIDESTLLVCATHAYYQNGFVQDVAKIAELAHAKGAYVYVDAYQTAGCIPIDIKALDVDFLATGCLKWMFGIPGVAFLYVRDELAHVLEPTVTGWFGRTDAFAFNPHLLDWHPHANRMETGTWPVGPAYVARGGIQVLKQVGLTNIRDYTKQLSEYLVDSGQSHGLSIQGTTDAERKTPVTAFTCPGDSHVAESLMRRRGIIVSARGRVIRLAPHFYNTPEECELALENLVAVFKDPELLASRSAYS